MCVAPWDISYSSSKSSVPIRSEQGWCMKCQECQAQSIPGQRVVQRHGLWNKGRKAPSRKEQQAALAAARALHGVCATTCWAALPALSVCSKWILPKVLLCECQLLCLYCRFDAGFFIYFFFTWSVKKTRIKASCCRLLLQHECCAFLYMSHCKVCACIWTRECIPLWELTYIFCYGVFGVIKPQAVSNSGCVAWSSK